MIDKNTVTGAISEEWMKEWEVKAPVALPPNWEDPIDMYKAIPRKQEITDKNKQILLKALYPISHLNKDNHNIG
jgi:acetoin utilization protein AcuC